VARAAVVDYIADAYANVGAPLFPTDVKPRASRAARSAKPTSMSRNRWSGWSNASCSHRARNGITTRSPRRESGFLAELVYFENELTGDFLVGELGAADFTLYPLLALALRMESRTMPDLDIAAHIGPRLTAWMRRIEALSFFGKTCPPHWRTAT